MRSRQSILAFIHVAKTGGQTVETMLRSTYGASYVHAEQWVPRDPDQRIQKYTEADFRRLKWICPVMRAVGGHSITLWSEIDRVQPVRWFAFLREPLARGASHFQFHQQDTMRPKTWDEWVAWDVPRNHQLHAFTPTDDPAAAIQAIQDKRVFVGLLEHFDESLVMLKRFVAPELRLAYARTNSAEDTRIAKAILDDPGKKNQLAQIHSGEFELYDYVKNELFPGFRREYGPALEEDVHRFAEHRNEGLNLPNDRLHRASRKFWLGPWGKFFRAKRSLR